MTTPQERRPRKKAANQAAVGKKGAQRRPSRTLRMKDSDGKEVKVFHEGVTKRGAYVATMAGSDTHILAIPDATSDGTSASVSLHASRGDEHSRSFTIDSRGLEDILGGMLRVSDRIDELWKFLLPNGLAAHVKGRAMPDKMRAAWASRDPASPLLDVSPYWLDILRTMVGYVDQLNLSTIGKDDVLLVMRPDRGMQILQALQWKTEYQKWVLFDLAPMLDFIEAQPNHGAFLQFLQEASIAPEAVALGENAEKQALREVEANEDLRVEMLRLYHLIRSREPDLLRRLERQ